MSDLEQIEGHLRKAENALQMMPVQIAQTSPMRHVGFAINAAILRVLDAKERMSNDDRPRDSE